MNLATKNNVRNYNLLNCRTEKGWQPAVLWAVLLVIWLGPVIPAHAQFAGANNMNPMDHGPFVSTTYTSDPANTGSIIAYKAIAVRVGSDPEAVMAFDTDLLRVSSAWTGGFLHWYPARDGLEEWPGQDGLTHFANNQQPGWSTGRIDDPRAWPYGPLPEEDAHYNGLYLHGDQVLFSYTVTDSEVLELFGFSRVQNQPVFTRTFNLTPTEEALSLLVLETPDVTTLEEVRVSESKGYIQLRVGEQTRAIGFQGVPEGAGWRVENRNLIMDLPALEQPLHFRLAIGPIAQGADSEYMTSYLNQAPAVGDLSELQEPGPALWQVLETEAVTGSEEGPFAVDELTVPHQNQWNSHLRLSDVDFLSDGRAAVASQSGDIWLVDGIGETLGTLQWQRFATGLNQPLGLKVVDDRIYVTGRDQITRLNDLNGDGHADFYENFNNEVMAATNFHAFTMNLETDSQGNFYFAKATPWPPVSRGVPAEVTPHHGVLFRLSPDGEDLEIIATGLRNPNGLGIGPNDEMIYADNEGNWAPTSKVQPIQEGGFHGFVPSAHTEGSVPGFNPLPTGEDYVKPMLWTPHFIDNSPAKPMFITSDRWPEELRDDLLLASYGRANLSLILKEEVDGQWQGAHLTLPLTFKSGLERGRFHEDGHLYIAGMTNWQSIGQDPGSLHRVRYTGQPLALPVALSTKAGGLEIQFSEELDPEMATDVSNFNLQQWTYPWSSQYGTRGNLYSVDRPGEVGADSVEVQSVTLSDDRRTVFLVIPDLQQELVSTRLPELEDRPDMIDASLGIIMAIDYSLRTADGTELDHLIHKTIHRVPDETIEDAVSR